MHEKRTTSFLARWKRQRQHVSRVQEPADHGTAYGLELTLDRIPDIVVSEPAPPAGTPSWMPRWRQSGSGGS
jgi:hypothetical protein